MDYYSFKAYRARSSAWLDKAINLRPKRRSYMTASGTKFKSRWNLGEPEVAGSKQLFAEAKTWEKTLDFASQNQKS